MRTHAGLDSGRRDHARLDACFPIHQGMASTTSTRFVVALADDADRVRMRDDVAMIDELPGVILAEVELAIAVELARTGEFVAIYTSLADAYRAFALFEPAS